MKGLQDNGNGKIEGIRHSGYACEPWGYVAPVVAAVLTRATGVRHIYLIECPRLGLRWDKSRFMTSGSQEVFEPGVCKWDTILSFWWDVP